MRNEPGGRRRVAALAAVSITELISWGTLYYALPVAAGDISRDEGWEPGAVTGALTLALLVSAALSIPVGHALSRFGPRTVMSVGAALAAAGLAVIAHAETLTVFGAGWVVAGMAMSMTLYPPAFAAAAQWFAPSPFRALTVITIFGALASTVFAPATSWLLSLGSWRDMYLTYAAIALLVTLPLHLFLFPRHTLPIDEQGTAHVEKRIRTRDVTRSWVFWQLAIVLSLGTLALHSLNLALVPYLQSRGSTLEFAAMALGLFGAGQILGRVPYPWLVQRFTPRQRQLVTLTTAAGLSFALAVSLSPRNFWIYVVIAILIGAARGTTTLIQASVAAELWPPHYYAVASGILALPTTIAAALSPWVATMTAEVTGSYQNAMIVFACISAGTAVISSIRFAAPAFTSHATARMTSAT